ncbi:molybdopterin-dependent oxidoreductase [Lacisediminihabitans changchengi]|uniref:Molybdopterin-dependent oxidoreductase n=1 Tax=Lacisediminihabitans changchengi TaxID=2787634 RepID=A0A934W3G7_9MICO|nr:molybdopterin-dependent oxidoreductase [Lacisediminihabitans changchengi]MBK4347194.1 molybdopterin-dependent oxidoreductase [Lacisediminihabitans changchengi]
MTTRTARWLAAFTGVVSAIVVLGAAELGSLVTGNAGSPIFAVGSLVIDLAPPGAKDLMISLFGTGDKAALLTLLAVIIVAGSAGAGILELRRPPFGVVVFGVASLIALIAVLTRAGSTGSDGVPTIIGAVVGVVVLRVAIQRLGVWRSAPVDGAASSTARRRFLTITVVAGAAALVAGTGVRIKNSGATVITEARKALKLPAPAVASPPVPSGAQLDVSGISPYITPNKDFYRIDTALVVPNVDADTWTLKVTGMVENEVEITFAELLKKPLTEHILTLTCVSNDVGGDLIGNARWLGWPIRELLALAVPKAGADMVLSTSIDGFTAGTPLDVLQDEQTDALLAVGMNGTPLPVEHGYPVRMVVPGLYGYVSATKWVVELEVTQFSKAQGYWTPRGWDAMGPVKLESRIDTPKDGARLSSGTTIPIAGVAWCQHIGVKQVELRVDDGPWNLATLADSVSADTWRQWVYQWEPTTGDHTFTVRATDANGQVQTQKYAPPAPNGAEGWASIGVTVG